MVLLLLCPAGAGWPVSACVLDPVRASVVCDGPLQIMEVASWFLNSYASGAGAGMRVCRVKNKFALHKEQLVR